MLGPFREVDADADLALAVVVDEAVARDAVKPIERMLELS